MALPLGWPAAPSDDAFIVTDSNARAAHLIEHRAAWPVMTALLVGPRRSGRTLLARIFAAKSGGIFIDDAERHDERVLFHAWNDAQAQRRPLLMVAAQALPDWTVKLPDLRSRLAASTLAVIGPPDDQLVRALFASAFERRGMPIRPDLIDWLAARIERSHLAVERAIDALDQAAMERRRGLSIPLARQTLTDAGIIAGAASEDQT
jgi:hypothetical protein